jgi:outer membrane murein-binding lipoprotein Lpp
LIEGYEKHIGDLKAEIEKLEAKVDALTEAMEDARIGAARRSEFGAPRSLR